MYDMSKLTKQNLEYVLWRFICEVKKSKDNADYPGRTFYQIVCAFQNDLKKQQAQDFNWVLNNVIQDSEAKAVGIVKCQVQVISLAYENSLWNRKTLPNLKVLCYIC